jgi:hypothetical protein
MSWPMYQSLYLQRQISTAMYVYRKPSSPYGRSPVAQVMKVQIGNYISSLRDFTYLRVR